MEVAGGQVVGGPAQVADRVGDSAGEAQANQRCQENSTQCAGRDRQVERAKRALDVLELVGQTYRANDLPVVADRRSHVEHLAGAGSGQHADQLLPTQRPRLSSDLVQHLVDPRRRLCGPVSIGGVDRSEPRGRVRSSAGRRPSRRRRRTHSAGVSLSRRARSRMVRSSASSSRISNRLIMVVRLLDSSA